MNIETKQPTGMLMGEAASTGLARGRALLCDCAKKIVVPQHEVSEAEAEREMERFDGALAGRVFINPGVRIVEKYDQVEANLQAHESALKDLVNVPAATTDGTAVTLSANIAQTADAAAAARVKADGAGLYRTEFTFFVQDGFPTEDEQYQFYRATAELLQPNRTVIRVLDIGSDKPLPYFPLPREDNPARGCRGTRLLLAHRSVFRVQLRAILRVSATYPVSILLPMITGLEETRAARSLIDEVKAELAGESASFDSGIAVGAMIETPSAALLAGRLAGEVDFFSVGTNDLVQYLLAADRLGNATDSAYDPLHPAVLQTLASLAAVAGENGKSISLCGEMAGDPMYTALLLGLGFRQFSVNPGRLLEIKHAIRSIHISEAKGLARAALAADTAAGIRAWVQDDWNRRRPVSPPDLPVAAS